MNSDNKSFLGVERTEPLPAQEKVAFGEMTTLQLTAEQVYAQRIAETPANGSVQIQGFIP